MSKSRRLTAEAVESAALSLQSVDDVEGGDGLTLGVLSVGDRVANDALKEELEDTTSLVVDQTRDTLNTTTTGETTDSGLGDTLDVVAQNLAVALGTTLAETFTTLSTTRHCLRLEFSCGRKNETDGGQVFVPKRGVPRATCGMSARQ